MFRPEPSAWLRWAVIYLVLGVSLGIFMAASHDFTLKPVHAHLNLLGWASMALAGLIYKSYPAAARTRLALLHFWSQVATLPVLLVALTRYYLGHAEIEPILGLTSVLAGIGILLFAVNVQLNVRD